MKTEQNIPLKTITIFRAGIPINAKIMDIHKYGDNIIEWNGKWWTSVSIRDAKHSGFDTKKQLVKFLDYSSY